MHRIDCKPHFPFLEQFLMELSSILTSGRKGHKMISIKNNQFPPPPSLLFSSIMPSSSTVKVMAKDGVLELPTAPLLLLSPLLRTLLSQEAQISTTIISLPSCSASTVTKLGELIGEGEVKVKGELEADDLVEAASLLGIFISKTQLIKSNQGEVSSDNKRQAAHNITANFDGIEPLKLKVKPMRVLMRNFLDCNKCDLCGQELRDKNAARKHVKRKHRDIHLKLRELCSRLKKTNPEGLDSFNENNLVRFSCNTSENNTTNEETTNEKENVKDPESSPGTSTEENFLSECRFESSENYEILSEEAVFRRETHDHEVVIVDKSKTNQESVVQSIENADKEEDVSSTETDPKKKAVDSCLLCGFSPRHLYVLWEHYLRHHFRCGLEKDMRVVVLLISRVSIAFKPGDA